jgi:hypothetical protein
MKIVETNEHLAHNKLSQQDAAKLHLCLGRYTV